MALSMHEASVPVFTRALGNLRVVLEKGEAGAANLQLAPGQLLQRALAPDMYPLVRQVQRACDVAAHGMAWLAGVAPRPFPDNEASFDDLYRRIAATIDYVGSFTGTQVNGSEELMLDVTLGAQPLQLSGRDLLFCYALPNLFFHCATAYDILRAAGIPLGKRDFLGTLPQRVH